MHDAKPQPDPGPILQTCFAFWSSKVLLTAVDFGLFTKLGDRRITGAELGAELGRGGGACEGNAHLRGLPERRLCVNPILLSVCGLRLPWNQRGML